MVVKIVQTCHNAKLNVKFLWIRGHVGIDGNEKVDALAKQGCISSNINNTTTVTDIRTSLLRGCVEDFVKYCTSYNRGLFYMSIQEIPDKRPWFTNNTLRSKHFVKTISRLRTDHGICPKYLLLIKRSETNLCQCGQVGNLEHIIMSCPSYNEERNTFFNNITQLIQSSFNYMSILKTKDKQIFAYI